MISERVEIIDQLLKIMNESEIETDPKIDDYIDRYDFDKNLSFFRWSSENNSLEIARLFSGEETIFYADIN